MDLLQFVTVCLGFSSVFMVSYVSISNYNARKKVDRNS
jgi:hypothetical protein